MGCRAVVASLTRKRMTDESSTELTCEMPSDLPTPTQSGPKSVKKGLKIAKLASLMVWTSPRAHSTAQFTKPLGPPNQAPNPCPKAHTQLSNQLQGKLPGASATKLQKGPNKRLDSPYGARTQLRGPH